MKFIQKLKYILDSQLRYKQLCYICYSFRQTTLLKCPLLSDGHIFIQLSQNQSVYLRNIQLQRAHKIQELSYSYTCDQEINRLATLDYGQRWLVLNPIPNNKHQVIKIHLLHKLCDLKFK